MHESQGKRRGLTLIELLLVCAIFTILIFITFGVIRYCTKSIGPIEDRTSVLMSVRRVQFSISEELRRSSWSSVLIGNIGPGDPYMHFICFQSFMSLSLPNSFSVTNAGAPEWTKYILYYVFRPVTNTGAQACSCKTPVSNPDKVCPHKGVVRVDILLSLNLNPHNEVAALASLKPYIQALPVSANDLKSIYFAKVNAWPTNGSFYANRIISCYYIAKEILSFDVNKTDTASTKEITVDVRCFKMKEGASSCQVGTADLTKSSYVIQSQSHIIVQNP